jgi:hypothetical protein
MTIPALPTAPALPTTPVLPVAKAPVRGAIKLPPTLPKSGGGAKPPRVIKTFMIGKPVCLGGERIGIVGGSGLGKTTLAGMAKKPIFVSCDTGLRAMRNSRTGEEIRMVEGIESFQDCLDALRQDSLYTDAQTIVFDNITKAVEFLGDEFIFDNYPLKEGRRANSLKSYGWDSWKHQQDITKLIIAELDRHARAGKDVVVIAQSGQARVSNAGGLDYMEDGPRLPHTKDHSARDWFFEWLDHCAFISLNMSVGAVVGTDGKIKAVGKASGSGDRVIHTQRQTHFLAKSREKPWDIPAAITFNEPSDNSFWQFFYNELEEEATPSK